jgi:predicted porin
VDRWLQGSVLKGREDLGGGLTASFDLENGFSVANGGYDDSNGNLFGRQAWVSIGGGFGTVTAGLQYSPFFLAVADSDPREMGQFGSALVIYGDNGAGTGVFSSNALSYTSPNIAGLQASVLLALGGEAGKFSAGEQYSASVVYERDALLINVVFFHGNGGGTVDTPVPTTLPLDGREIGIRYKFGNLTASASFVKYKVAASFDNNVYGGGVKYLTRLRLRPTSGIGDYVALGV